MQCFQMADAILLQLAATLELFLIVTVVNIEEHNAYTRLGVKNCMVVTVYGIIHAITKVFNVMSIRVHLLSDSVRILNKSTAVEFVSAVMEETDGLGVNGIIDVQIPRRTR